MNIKLLRIFLGCVKKLRRDKLIWGKIIASFCLNRRQGIRDMFHGLFKIPNST